MSFFKQVTGLSLTAAQNGVLISSMPDSGTDRGGPGPVSFSYSCVAHGLTPDDVFIVLNSYPGDLFNSGTDNLGNISNGFPTWSNNGDDINFVGPSLITATNGFWQASCVAFLNIPLNTPGVTVDFTITGSITDITSYNQTLNQSPDTFNIDSNNYNPLTGDATLQYSFNYDNHDGENPTGFAISINNKVVGSIPWQSGTTHYIYADTIFNASGSYTIEAQAYRYSDSTKSGFSNTQTVTYGSQIPDINVTGSGGMEMTGAAAIVFVTDASGVYVLTPGQTHDVLYDRVHQSTTNVNIPDPFVKFGYIGG